MKTCALLRYYLARLFLEQGIFQTKVLEKIKNTVYVQ
jgi:hypothetical protein